MADIHKQALVSVLNAFKECLRDFNTTRLIMDDDARGLAGEIILEYQEVIRKAEETL